MSRNERYPSWTRDQSAAPPESVIEDLNRLTDVYGEDLTDVTPTMMMETLGCSQWQTKLLRIVIKEDRQYAAGTARQVMIVADELPPPRPIQELINERIASSKRDHTKTKRHNRELTLPVEPIGIMIFGDPHVDSGHCNWPKLHQDVELARKTEGVVAACVGDQHDNWIGRLARLYAGSDCTAADGWRLSRWMFDSLTWIALVGGNHDAWANGPGIDPMQLLTKECGVMCYAPDEIRITLKWRNRPDLEPLVWVLRHDFKGRSWYHATHGPHKEATLDGKCHLLTAGHIHQWGQLTTEQRHGRITHAVRVKGYKRDDDFARAKGFPEQQHGEACLVVIDPAAVEPGRISIFWNLEQGCDFLTKLREGYNA